MIDWKHFLSVFSFRIICFDPSSVQGTIVLVHVWFKDHFFLCSVKGTFILFKLCLKELCSVQETFIMDYGPCSVQGKYVFVYGPLKEHLFWFKFGLRISWFSPCSGLRNVSLVHVRFKEHLSKHTFLGPWTGHGMVKMSSSENRCFGPWLV